jgi:pyruvate kinase
VGVDGAIASLQQGEIVTLDLLRGEVHLSARSHNSDSKDAIV